jgi:hypothetical protein
MSVFKGHLKCLERLLYLPGALKAEVGEKADAYVFI